MGIQYKSLPVLYRGPNNVKDNDVSSSHANKIIAIPQVMWNDGRGKHLCPDVLVPWRGFARSVLGSLALPTMSNLHALFFFGESA